MPTSQPGGTRLQPFAPRGRICSIVFLCVLAAPSLAQNQGASTSASLNLKFSHRLHLVKVRATCTDCHTAAPASTAATDNLLPREAACLNCHDGHKARKQCAVCHPDPARAHHLEAPQHAIRFSHKQHLEFGDLGPILAGAIKGGQYLSQPPPAPADLASKNACAACHRGLARTAFAGPRNLPQMADCIVCHSKIDPPFSCSFCHTQQAQLKPASHTPDFLDSHTRPGAKLDKPSCAICHGVRFRCMGCH